VYSKQQEVIIAVYLNPHLNNGRQHRDVSCLFIFDVIVCKTMFWFAIPQEKY
jgi:hypothetical protein